MGDRVPDFIVCLVVRLATRFIQKRHNRFYRLGRELAPEELGFLAEFFPAEVLHSVRLVRRQMPVPWFYRYLPAVGFLNLLDFADIAAITFLDTVVHPDPLSRDVLFHELVHVVQYRELGLAGFADRYVRGFLAGGSYEDIPLEQQAHELDARFRREPEVKFSVLADVRQKLAYGRL